MLIDIKCSLYDIYNNEIEFVNEFIKMFIF